MLCGLTNLLAKEGSGKCYYGVLRCLMLPADVRENPSGSAVSIRQSPDGSRRFANKVSGSGRVLRLWNLVIFIHAHVALCTACNLQPRGTSGFSGRDVRGPKTAALTPAVLS